MPQKSNRDNNGKAVQSIEPQSSWFTHWTGTRYESSTHHPSTQIKEADLDIKISSDIYRSSKSIKDMDLSISLKKPSTTQSFPFFKRGQENVKSFTINEEVKHASFQPEESSSSHQMKYHMFFGETVFASKNQEHKTPSFLRQESSLPIFKTDPSTSNINNNHPSPSFVEDQYKRMQKHIGLGFFPHQEMIKPGTVHSFSRTTHSLLITKQTDVELYQEKQIFRESLFSTQLKQEPLKEVNQSQRGVKLQLLDSSESNEKIENVQKNESSADTDTMDLSGVHVSTKNKDITVESNLPLLPPIKDTRRKRKIELPDINLEISDLAASSNSNEKAEPCTSRTQSLDMNNLHFNLDNATNSRSEECSNSTNHGSDPGNRWIKRLKLTSSSSLPKNFSETRKSNKYVTKVTEERNSDLRLDENRRKSEKIEIGETSSVKEGDDITLSHSWIQRWSRNQGEKVPAESCKAENPKSATEEYEKKQFPSIAAMALMGKAMSGFQQCKFQKKESFVVWNTKGFE